MTNEKMSQATIGAYELTDAELEMVTGGKGRGGTSILRDIVDLVKWLFEKHGKNK